LNYDKCEYLKNELNRAGCTITFAGTTFNEFVVRFPRGTGAIYENLLKKNIVAGLPLDTYYPELAGHYLLCVTETKTRNDMDALVREVQK
jgi:glycine dehydrogenase subunit 1